MDQYSQEPYAFSDSLRYTSNWPLSRDFLKWLELLVLISLAYCHGVLKSLSGISSEIDSLSECC